MIPSVLAIRSTRVTRVFALTILGSLAMAIPGLAGEAITGRLSDRQLSARIDESTIIKLDWDAQSNEPKVVFENGSGKYVPGLAIREGQEVVFQWLPDERVLWVASPREIRKVDFSQEGTTRSVRYVTADFHPDKSVPGWFARAVKELK